MAGPNWVDLTIAARSTRVVTGDTHQRFPLAAI